MLAKRSWKTLPGIKRTMESACVDMFNKNIAAYLMYNFLIKEVGKEFIKRLLRVSVDPELIKGIGDSTWDKKTRVLTTPKDIERLAKRIWKTLRGIKRNMESRIRTAVRSTTRRRNCWRRKISTLWEMTTLTQRSMSVQERTQARQVLL